MPGQSVASSAEPSQPQTRFVIPGRGLQPVSPESMTLGQWLWIPGSRLKSGLPDFSIKSDRNRQQPISIERDPE